MTKRVDVAQIVFGNCLHNPILDVFLAFFCGKRIDLAIIAKREPFAEGVELLHFIGRLVNDFAQFGIRDTGLWGTAER